MLYPFLIFGNGNGRSFGRITAEVPSDINTMGERGNIWEVTMELYLFVHICVSFTEPQCSIHPRWKLQWLDLESVAVLSPLLTLDCPIPL